MIRVELLPVERLLFRSSVVTIGRFDCEVRNPLFRDSGATANDLVVFPRSSVGIVHDGRPLFVSTTTNVNFYNRGQRYTRKRIDDRDRCDWFALDREQSQELSRHKGAKSNRPFSFTHGPLDPAHFLAERRLIQEISAGRLSALEIEERTLTMLRDLVDAAHRAWSAPSTASRPSPTRKHRDLAEGAKAILTDSMDDRLSLGQIANELGVSPFHLSRVFRSVTGKTLADFRKELRLFRAADVIADTALDLTTVAADHGFVSHSHLTFDFRRRFGVTPSRLRAEN
jgi:AraC-like DNA-binding protein